ncbi:PEP-CTERM sorting domain-containing protein [Dapis sp. BLCC M126]|uniref:PEP-CTERM sorting domain-containing protein n=1 Tax=Dapis sp. BLCC M126 TaxID=3400189 RepID=UPI003CF13A2B
MNNAIKAAIALPISIGVVISGNSTHAASFTYAETVEFYDKGEFQYDNAGQIATRTNVNNALGAPEANANNNFLALGVGGEAVFSFGGMFSEEVKVWETTLGKYSSQSDYDEKVEVFVGNDLQNWLSIGTIENIADEAYIGGATLDIGNNNLYQYVRLVDMSEDLEGRDGFDINAIAVNMEGQRERVPESSTTLSLLAIGALAISSLSKRKQQ